MKFLLAVIGLRLLLNRLSRNRESAAPVQTTAGRIIHPAEYPVRNN